MANDNATDLAADLSILARKYGGIALVQTLRDTCVACYDHLGTGHPSGDAFAEAAGYLTWAIRQLEQAELSGEIALADGLEVLGEV